MTPEKRAELGRRLAEQAAARLRRLGNLAKTSPLAAPSRSALPTRSRAKSKQRDKAGAPK